MYSTDVESLTATSQEKKTIPTLYVKKRDGKTLVPFDRSKIAQAINKAFIASGEVTTNNEKVAEFVCSSVLSHLFGKRSVDSDLNEPLDIEDIQNTVEDQLMKLGYFVTAKKFIIYRKNRSDARIMAKEKLVEHIEEYFGKAAWDIKENSNMDYSLQGLNNFVTSKVMNMYWMTKVYTPEIREAHQQGKLHVHDASLLSCYCMGWDLKDLLLSGFGGVAGTNTSGPAKHFDAILGQIWNFLYSLQGEAAGAQAFSNFDTYLAPFVYYDNLTYRDVKQHFQKFMHNMTTKTRVGFQCVPDTYQCLTPEGWKSYHELKIGDQIYVFDKNSNSFSTDTIKVVNSYAYEGEMINFRGPELDFITTPTHKTLHWIEVFKRYSLNDSESIHDELGSAVIPSISDLALFKIKNTYTETSVVPFSGTVWCPTTTTGTFICKAKNGKVFVTGNSPFTNVSMDLYVPEHMKDEPAIVGGKFMDKTYKEFQKEMDMINKAFCEVMIEGDSEGRQFPFPIPNYSITKDFDWENPNLEPLWKLTGKYGAPYFTNFINSDLNPEDVRSMCPLHPDERIYVRMNGHYVNMRIEDVYKVLAYKTVDNVYVRLNDKEIKVSGVMRHTSKGFIKIYTDLDPDGICMDHVHLQPYRLCIVNNQGKLECTSMKVVEAFFLPRENCYVPYSKTTFTDIRPTGSLELDDMIWVPVRAIEHVGLVTQYSYCIEVDSKDHLFEMGPGRLITHNCRLQLNNKELRKRGGGLFGANPLTGSIGVVTINLPVIGYLHKGDKEGFFKELDHQLDLAYKSLMIKRQFIESKCEEGLYPFSKFYTRDTKARHGEHYYNHFSTIGVVGGNECALNFLDKNIMDPDGLDFIKSILIYIRNRMVEFQEKSGYPFNLEASPKLLWAFLQ